MVAGFWEVILLSSDMVLSLSVGRGSGEHVVNTDGLATKTKVVVDGEVATRNNKEKRWLGLGR